LEEKQRKWIITTIHITPDLGVFKGQSAGRKEEWVDSEFGHNLDSQQQEKETRDRERQWGTYHQ
jgi:hypothetical protein